MPKVLIPTPLRQYAGKQDAVELGAPLGMYLAAAGVGRIGVVDFDVVDFTNLQRQVIHGSSDVGRKKLDSAAETMNEINPYVQIDKHDTALTSENALELFRDYDI